MVDVPARFGILISMLRTVRVKYPGAIYQVMDRPRWGSDAMDGGDLPSSDYGKARRWDDQFEFTV